MKQHGIFGTLTWRLCLAFLACKSSALTLREQPQILRTSKLWSPRTIMYRDCSQQITGQSAHLPRWAQRNPLMNKEGPGVESLCPITKGISWQEPLGKGWMRNVSIGSKPGDAWTFAVQGSTLRNGPIPLPCPSSFPINPYKRKLPPSIAKRTVNSELFTGSCYM